MRGRPCDYIWSDKGISLLPELFSLPNRGDQDQFGGEDRRKFMIKRLKELLLQIHQLPMIEQKIS